MSYQVLARKWRPRSFEQLVGQEHVLKALVNALDQDRLHHAYLFTGTRGVGKTTIARILAKCLNCEEGVRSVPCGECSSCVAIKEGRSVDLIEVDAASRTKVEDTRELLENVQYAPTSSRFKIYLIDEVHMLSNHSFNALLKTLEEPPPHVKFLLATTDPQKLPVTILSRCLQFNLKNLSPEMIVGHLKHVLHEEQIQFEESALWHLARAADGSMRDALSLTDQGIAYGESRLREADIAQMLGTIDRSRVYSLVQALIDRDAQGVLQVVADIADYSPDFAAILEELISILHRIAVVQTVPETLETYLDHREMIMQFADTISPQDLQLYYQIALIGRRDLPLNPQPRSGLEMVLLRMLAFKPQLDDPSTPKKKGLNREPEPTAGTGDRKQRGAVQPSPVNARSAVADQADGSTTVSIERAKLGLVVNNRLAEKEPISANKLAEELTSPGQKERLLSPESPPSAGDAKPLATEQEPSALKQEPSANGVEPSASGQKPSALAKQPLTSAKVPWGHAHQLADSEGVHLTHAANQSVPERQGADGSPEYPGGLGDVTGGQATVTAKLTEHDGAADQHNDDFRNQADTTQLTSKLDTDHAASLGHHQILSQKAESLMSNPQWIALAEQLPVKGMSRNVLLECVFSGFKEKTIELHIHPQFIDLMTSTHESRINHALLEFFGEAVRIRVTARDHDLETPSAWLKRMREQKLEKARQALENDKIIRSLQEKFGARFIAESIEPFQGNKNR